MVHLHPPRGVRLKRRHFLIAIPTLGTLVLAGCQDGASQSAEKSADTKIALGLTGDEFVTKFNESLPGVIEEIKEGDQFTRNSLVKMYTLYDHSVTIGSTQGVFKAISGPNKMPIFGTTTVNGELKSVGSSLGDNSNDARNDFLLIMTTIGYVLTSRAPKEIHRMLLRLIVTLVNNPDEAVSEGLGNMMFTASLSRTGMAIHAEHKQ
jgi:hypothetical protein